MATPRVFLSSTCYDLAEVRDSLHSFISGMGFDPCLSDRGDVFYHPDLHTHSSCLNEVGNCHLFILVIGGRFGGTYVADTARSIVNAEYAAARELGLPVFTFVKREVWADHRVFQSNKSNEPEKIKFPSVDRQENAAKIFAFIDEVRLAPTNNGFFEFTYSSEIETLLRKQWAGMFFDALHQRKQLAEARIQTAILTKLTSTSEQMEQLVKKIYEKVDEDAAPEVIKSVEMRAEAAEFLRELSKMYATVLFPRSSTDDLVQKPLPASWADFMTRTGEFVRANVDFRVLGRSGTTTYPALRPAQGGRAFPLATVEGAPATSARLLRLERSYAAFLQLDQNDQKQVLTEFKDLNTREYSDKEDSE